MLVPTAASAAEHDVCASGCDHTTIGDAIAAASGGDTIRVATGVYAESLLIEKDLTILGPNIGISPNSGNGSGANPARVAEAVIKPPAGSTPNQPKDNNPGAHIKGDLGTVEISGFTFDMVDGIPYNAYIWSASGPQNLVLTDNIFQNANYGSVGSIVANYNNDGDFRLEVTHNRFLDRKNSNGLRMRNPSAGAATTVLVENNVWLDNEAWALNFSSEGGVMKGSISHNWVGNSTPSQGTDAFGYRQSGFLLYGEYSELLVEGNTFSHIEDGAINFYVFWGTASVVNNRVDNYFAGPTYSTIRVRPATGSDPVSVIDDVHFEAELNWWGQDSGPNPGQVTGPDVNVSPWFAGSCDDGSTVLGVSADGPVVPLTYGTGSPTVEVDEDALVEGSYYVYQGISEADVPADGPFDPGTSSGVDVDLRVDGESIGGGPFTVCFDAEEGQSLWHLQDGEWVDITAEDAPEGRICGVAESLGQFIVGSPAPEVPEEPTDPEEPVDPEEPTDPSAPTDTVDPEEEIEDGIVDMGDGEEEDPEGDLTPIPGKIAEGGLGSPVLGLGLISMALLAVGVWLFQRRNVDA